MTAPLPLGILRLDREPLTLSFGSFFENVKVWAQDAGGFATFFLFCLLFARAVAERSAPRDANNRPIVEGPALFAGLGRILWPMLLLSLLAWMVGGVISFVEPPSSPPREGELVRPGPVVDICFTIGGLLGLIGFTLPFLRELGRFQFRRIWAIARLSIIEVLRRRVLLIFLVLLIPVLFPERWFFTPKAEDELRFTIDVFYWSMTPLVLVLFSLLAAFGLPTDVKNQNIHTIVTKPVERFEIVLGRFLGYSTLITLVMLVWSAGCLLLLNTTRVSQEAQEESFRARVPLYGQLSFRDWRKPFDEFRGESVGREDEYRSYIAGGDRSPFRAIWAFNSSDLQTPLFSSPLGDLRPSVKCEFSFDIFRTTKGEEGKSVDCSFTFVTCHWGTEPAPWGEQPEIRPSDPAKLNEYRRRLREENIFPQAQPHEKPADGRDLTSQEIKENADFEKLDKLAEEFGVYEYRAKPIFDYHTQTIEVPPGLFRNAFKAPPPEIVRRVQVGNQEVERTMPAPLVMIFVKCDNRTQFLGVARRDLYLLAGEESFAGNFIKGAIGLWMRAILVVGIAVALSTYLTGVIAWLAAIFLFVIGTSSLIGARPFVISLANGTSIGGGPAESLFRLVTNQNIAVQIESVPATNAVNAFDIPFRFILRRVVNGIPDVDRYNWSHYVSSGFHIGAGDLMATFLMLIGYLLPWGLLAYYMIKSREVAA